MSDRYKYDWSGKAGDYLIKAPVRGIVFGGAQLANWIMGRLPGVPREVEQANARDIQKMADILFPYRTNDGDGNSVLHAEEFVSGMVGGRNVVRLAGGGANLTKQMIVKTATNGSKRLPTSLKPPPLFKPGKVTQEAAREATIKAHKSYQNAIGTAGEQAAKDAWKTAEAAESSVLGTTKVVEKVKKGYDLVSNGVKRYGPWVSRPATMAGQEIAKSSPVVLGSPYSTALAFLGDNIVTGAMSYNVNSDARAIKNEPIGSYYKTDSERSELAKSESEYRNSLATLKGTVLARGPRASSDNLVSDYRLAKEDIKAFRESKDPDPLGTRAKDAAAQEAALLKAAMSHPKYAETITNQVDTVFIPKALGFSPGQNYTPGMDLGGVVPKSSLKKFEQFRLNALSNTNLTDRILMEDR